MEGYQLYMVRWQDKVVESQTNNTNVVRKPGVTSLLQLDFVKSLLTVNPYMVHKNICNSNMDDILYIYLFCRVSTLIYIYKVMIKST